MNEYNKSDFFKLQAEILDVESCFAGNVEIDYGKLREFNSASDNNKAARIFSDLFAAASKQFASRSKLDSVTKALKGVSVTDLVYSCPREFIFDRLIKFYLQNNNLCLDDVYNNKKFRELFANWCNIPIEAIRSFKLASMQSASINIAAQLRAILGTALHNYLERIFKLASEDTSIAKRYRIYPEYRIEWNKVPYNLQLIGKIDLLVHDLSADEVFMYDYKFRYPSSSQSQSFSELIKSLFPEDLINEQNCLITSQQQEEYAINENYKYESYILQFAIYYWLLKQAKPELADKVSNFSLVFFDGSYIEFVSLDSKAIKALENQVQLYINHWLSVLKQFKQKSEIPAVNSLQKFKECTKCKYKHLCKVVQDRCTINFSSSQTE